MASLSRRKGVGNGPSEVAEKIEELRHYYHSVRDGERAEVIELLGGIRDANAARELIHLYRECQWRDTRLQIIRALSRHPTQRGLEFLFRLALEPSDLPIAEAAIRSLGQSHHPLAARFLVHAFPKLPAPLRPAAICALGQLPDRTLAPELLAELPKAIAARQPLLVKSLVLALGELKMREALPALERLALDPEEPSAALSALMAIGKIARDPAIIDRVEPAFRDDPFAYQLFTTAKTQVQFRSRWKLEDYLTRLFGNGDTHPSLPYELCHFDPEDVKAGLKLFAGPEHMERLCLALARLDFPGVAGWYGELFDLKRLAPREALLVLESISCRLDPALAAPLAAIREGQGKATPEWLRAVAMSLPDADVELKRWFESPEFSSAEDEAKVGAINQLVDFGLTALASPAKRQAIGRILEATLDASDSPAVRGRTLRALGHLGVPSRKAAAFAKEALSGAEPHEEITRSCLKFLELCPEKPHGTLLLKCLEQPWARPEGVAPLAFLKALAAQPYLPEQQPALDAHLGAALAAAPEVRIEALQLLALHPRGSLLAETISCLKGEERVQLAAVIALKSLGSESAVEPLAALLRADSQSLSGRALDTLTSLPGLRAKRVVIDFLKERSDDRDVCDKVIRCLKAPETPTPYFVQAIDEILAREPRHPSLDGLLLLRERLAVPAGGPSQDGSPAAKGADTAAVDRELAARLAWYESYDESVKSALRSAELPYLHREMFDEFVDKSSSVVEYCKAIDMLLEKTIGKRHLFPRLEQGLQEFQNLLHASGLNDEFARAEWVLRQLGLEKHFTPQSFPLHKAVVVAQSIRNGRIINEHFRAIDGLRAWAVVLLIFGRKAPGAGGKALIPLKAASEDQVVSLCKRLIALQETRNPVAHRQTVLKFVPLDEIRGEVFAILNALHKMLC